MSEIELGPAVVGAVKALATAYKNAFSILENIKEQRKARGASSPPDELEEALQEGQWEIEKIQAQGVQRFRGAFEQGDDIAYRAIRETTIDAQSSFLTLAGRDDGTIDFEACIDSAIGARLRAVNILNELYLRQAKRARSNTGSDAAVSQRSSTATQLTNTTGSDTATSQRSSVTKIPIEMAKPVLDTSKPLPDIYRASTDEMKEVVEASSSRPPMRRSATIESRSSGRPSSEKSSGSIRLSRKSSWAVLKFLQRTPSAELPPLPADIVSPLTPLMATASLQAISPALSPQTLPMQSPMVAPLSTTPGNGQIMTPPISPISTMSPLHILAAAGFCKGAAYIQQGEIKKGLQLSAKNMEWTTHCRKCPFAVAALNVQGRPRFDDKAYSTSKLRWRSLVLFKSHLPTSQRKKRIYKCVLCVLKGDSKATYESEHDLFEHMIDHQGGVLSGVELWGSLCLEATGPRVSTETTFDICFAENPRFALPESAFEMSIATEIFEADGKEIFR